MGKYVCYGEEDGSFTWGRIKDEGFQNTPDGEKEVFVLTDQITCRVPKNDLELATIQRLDNLIPAGKSGPLMLPGPTDPSTLPDYQRFGNCKQLPAKTESKAEEPKQTLPAVVGTPEGKGLVPKLEDEMGLAMPRGLKMAQMAGTVISSVDGHKIRFLLRKYGYDTSVRKERLNLETDIVDAKFEGLKDLTDDELFLLAMRAKVANTTGRLSLGMRNMLMLDAGDGEDGVAERAVSTLKERRNMV